MRLAAVALALVLVPAALAAPPRLTVARVNREVSEADLPRPFEGSYLAAHPQTASCRGIGKPVKRGYLSFRCAVTAGSGDRLTTFTAWAQSTTRGLCATSVAAAVCARRWTNPDPRTCYPGLTRGVDYCTYENARLAMRRQVGATGGTFQGPTSCTPAGAFRFDCVAKDPYLVVWANGAWSVTPG